MAIVKQGSTILNAGAKGEKGDDGSSGGSGITTYPITLLSDLTGDQSANANKVWVLQANIDMGSVSITLPNGVYLKNEQGSLINGTIDLSGGIIDAQLLHYTMDFSNGKAKEDTFYMNVVNSGLDETNLVDEANPTAGELIMGQTNKERIQHMINQASNIGITRFSFPDMDVWLDMSALYLGFGYMGNLDERFARGLDIFLQSDTWYELQGGSKFGTGSGKYDPNKGTKIKMIANNDPGAKIFSVFEKQNVKFTGGVLIGDREHHDYSPVIDEGGSNRGSHDYGTLLGIHGVHNMLVEGCFMTQHPGDCIIIDGSSIRNIDGIMSESRMETLNLIVRGCELLYARRNCISMIDGRMMTIEQNTIAYAGNGYAFPGSGVGNWGTLPMNGIDIEPYQEGIVGSLETALYEDGKNIIIRNNDFYGNYKLDVNCFKGNRILIENNTFTNQLNIQFSFEIIIRGNTGIMDDTLDVNLGNKPGISISNFLKINAGGTFELVYGNIITDNILHNYDIGIATNGGEVTIKDNKVYDFLRYGINAGGSNVLCHGNVVKSNVVDAYGVEVQNSSGHTAIYENNIIVVPNGSAIFFDGVNQGQASSTIKVAAGGSGSIDTVTANGVSIISGVIPYNTSLIQTATDLAANINAHTSIPNYTATSAGSEVIVKPVTAEIVMSGDEASEFHVIVTATDLTMYYTNFTEAPNLKKVTFRDNFIDSPEMYFRGVYGLQFLENEITGKINYENIFRFKINDNWSKNTISTAFIEGFYTMYIGEIKRNTISCSATSILSLNGVDVNGARFVEIMDNNFNKIDGTQSIYILRGTTENFSNIIANNRFSRNASQTDIKIEGTDNLILDNYSYDHTVSYNLTGTGQPIKYTKPNPACPSFIDNATALAVLGEGYYYKDTTSGKFEVTIA